MRRLILHLATSLFAFLLLVPPAGAGWVWPTRGEVITPYRNGTDPYAAGQHRGIDIAAAAGAPVVAAAAGQVRFAGTAGSSGLTVSIRTADGRYDTSYLHLSSTSVREGDQVAAGQSLGAVGTSGTRSATAPHVHFGVRDAGSRHAYHDPLGFLPPPAATPPPRGAPAPEPAPVPVGPAPAPAPVNAPATRPVPVRRPLPRPVPAGEPRRVPVGAPRRVPSGQPRPVPSGQPRPVPSGQPRPVPLGAPHRVPLGEPRSAPQGEPGRVAQGEPGRVPQGEPGRVALPAPDGAPRRAPAAEPHRVPAGEPGGASADARRFASPGTPLRDQAGPDLGLLAACLGLLAAAALLALTGDRREATTQTGHRIARLLHPTLGRR